MTPPTRIPVILGEGGGRRRRGGGEGRRMITPLKNRVNNIKEKEEEW